MTRLLIVDDNPQSLYLLQALLAASGCEVELASNGAEALEAAQRNPPDMVVSDVLMPVMDGFALCRAWKADERLGDIPFVFYTATYTDPQDEEFALGLGAASFIVKPTEPDKLLALLREVMAAHRAGGLGGPRQPVTEAVDFYERYSATLVRKLEDKLTQLEAANRTLARELGARRQAENEMAESLERERFLGSIVRAASVAIGVGYPDGRLGMINPAFQRLTGYSEEELKTIAWNTVLTPPEWLDSEMTALAELHRTKKPVVYEKEYIRKSGQRVPIELVVHPLVDASGEVERYFAFVTDITERKRAEEALRGSERRIQSIFRSAPLGIGVVIDRVVMEANPRLCELTGYGAEELFGRSARMLYPSDEDFELVGREKYRQIREHGTGTVETRWKRKNGAVINVLLSSAPIDAGDMSKGVTFTALDITARVEAEKALADRQALLGAIYRNAPLVMMVVNAERRVQQVNGFAAQFVGRPAEEMLGLRGGEALRCLHALDDPRGCGFGEYCHECVIRNTVLDTIETGETHLQVDAPYHFQDTDGGVQEMTVLCSTTPLSIGKESLVLVTLLDITERKRQEMRIEHLNRVLRAIRDVNQLITHEEDRDMLLRRTCEILISTRGYRSAWAALRGEDGAAHTVAESGIGEDFAPLRQALERGEWPACCRQAWERPEGIAPIHETDRNCRACDLSHSYRDTAALAGVLRHSGRDYGALVVALPRGMADDPEEQSLFRELVGDVAYALHAMDLVSEREEAIEALRLSEERFRVAQEMSPDGFTILHPVRNTQGEIVDFEWVYENPTIARVNGTDPSTIVGERLLTVFPAHKGTPLFEAYLQVADTGTPRVLGEVYAGEIVSRPTWLRIVIVSMGEDIAILAQDTTERREAEVEREGLRHQLAQAQKLESVGRLAGGVAHDFNNVLQALMAGVQSLRLRSHDTATAQAATEIEKYVKRGAALTRQLLLFSRREQARVEPVNVNELVREAAVLLRRLLPANIGFAAEFAPGEPFVDGDRGQLDQVLMNLVVNARDAMLEGGRLLVRTGLRGESEVLVEVSDSGVGMPASVCERIFDPFFTTKGVGHGTGLGLAVVHGIVTQHGGYIEVQSEPGHGSTFRVVLPRRTAARGLDPGDELADLPGSGRGERVLVVEDEEGAREGLAELLDLLGYQPTVAASAEQALGLPEAPAFDVLLSDLMLPGMSGGRLASILLARWPTLRVILMSGYLEDERVRHEVPDGVRFLQKPFDADALGREIRSVLDAQTS